MAVSYEEAREAVRRKFGPTWSHGTFCLDDRVITETDTYYVFAVGAREFLVDDDDSYEAIGSTTVVYKADGSIGSLRSPDVAMDPTIKSRPNPEPTLEV